MQLPDIAGTARIGGVLQRGILLQRVEKRKFRSPEANSAAVIRAAGITQ